MSSDRAANDSLRKTTADDVDIVVSGLQTGETLDSLISDATQLLSQKTQHEGNLNQAALTRLALSVQLWTMREIEIQVDDEIHRIWQQRNPYARFWHEPKFGLRQQMELCFPQHGNTHRGFVLDKYFSCMISRKSRRSQSYGQIIFATIFAFRTQRVMVIRSEYGFFIIESLSIIIFSVRQQCFRKGFLMRD
jgi:hypothetical protein